MHFGAIMREAWVSPEPKFLSSSVCFATGGDPSAVPHGSTSGVFRNRSLFTLKLDVVAVFSAATSLVRLPQEHNAAFSSAFRERVLPKGRSRGKDFSPRGFGRKKGEGMTMGCHFGPVLPRSSSMCDKLAGGGRPGR